MANDNFVNYTGLGYFLNRIKTIFAGKTEFDALDAKVDAIVAEGGEPNVIETIKIDDVPLTPDAEKAVNIDLSDYATLQSTSAMFEFATHDGDTAYFGKEENLIHILTGISGPEPAQYFNELIPTKGYVDENGGKIDVIKVNGTAQTITNKEVDIAVPESTSDLQNDGDGTSAFATESYVDENGGKIDVIKLNGAAQTIVNKEVDLTVITSEQVDDAINAAIAGITQFDFQVVTELPAEGVKGIIYLVAKGTGKLKNVYDEYIWTGTDFEQIGDTQIDLSGYWQEDELVAVTTAEIDALFEE